jgi:hypothetical protein
VAAGFIGVPSSGRYWYLCTEVLTVCPNNYPDSSFPYRRVRMPLGPTAWSGKVDARSRAAAAQETVDIRSGPHGGARYTPARSTLPTTVWTMLDARVGMVLQQPNRQSRSGTERGPQLWNDFDEISEPSEGTRSRGMRSSASLRDMDAGFQSCERDPMKSGYLMTRHTAPHSASMRFSRSRTAR